MFNRPTFAQRLALRWLKLPYFPFQKRVIRKLLFNKLVILPINEILLECTMGDYISDHLLANGIYEPLSIKMANNLLSQKDVFVDVGANIGLYTIILGIQQKCHVVAFEPNQATFEILRRNIALNGLEGNSTIIPCALSDQAGLVPIYLADPKNIGGSSMTGGGTLVNFAPAITLASALGSLGCEFIKLLKIDVEGAEALVLSGVDLRKVEVIIVEWHGLSKKSVAKEFLASTLYKDTFSEFNAFDVTGNPADEVEFFIESNVLLKKK